MPYTIIQYPAFTSAFTAQPSNRRIDMMVLHSTAGTKAGDLYTLSGRDRSHLVSVHYYITKLGEIYQLVQDKDVAWHAGVSYWQGETNCNRFSLGIELENLNDGLDKYPQPQLDALMWLCQSKVRQYNIHKSRFVRHVDVAPSRKTDPRGFPWDTFKADVYHDIPDIPPPPPVPQPSPKEKLRDALIDFAYGQVRHVYHPDWAMHQFAIQQRLGPPLVPAFRFRAEGQEWIGELYGVDAICQSSRDPNTVRRLSDLPQGELKTTFRGLAYAQLGVQYHPDWSQHQFADQNKIGLPLSENVRLNLHDGRPYGTQIFSLDTLFSPNGTWGTVSRLSTLLDNDFITPQDKVLRDALINQLYLRIGTRFHPDWVSHQFALDNRLGAPITDQKQLQVDRQDYMVLGYARSVIFAPVGDWTLIKSLNELLDELDAGMHGGYM